VKKFFLPVIFGMLGILIVMSACSRHHVTADTTHRVEIAPIHVTVDINLKVQRALNDALDFQGDLGDIFTEEELQQLK
jgi:hypothetical protein